MSQRTSPSIGTGDIKTLRDYSINGYCVGSTPGSPEAEPVLVDPSKHHIMAYDVEVEFFGPAYCSLDSPILCASLICSCGHRVVISRHKARIPNVRWIDVADNGHMAEEIMNAIVDQNPIFTIGQNVYDFDNVKIALALDKGSRYRSMFKSTSTVIGSSTSSMGLVMDLPGINNFDTLRYIRKAMPMRFRSFKLGSLAIDLNLDVTNQETALVKHNMRSMSSSITNILDMVRYNMADCDVTLSLCFKLDLINQINNDEHGGTLK